MTVDGREFYVYRYEGEPDDIMNAAVILSYPKEAFGNPKALRVFISTNVGAGVTFTLVGDDGSEYTGTTDSNGEAVFEELIPQHYVLTEIKTAEGHELLKEPVDITIPLEMTEAEAKDQGVDISKAVWDESAGEDGNGAYCFYDLTYEISNGIKTELPQTGGSPSAVFLLFVAGLIGVGIFVAKKKRLIK